MDDRKPEDPLLLPAPQRLQFTGGRVDLPGNDLAVEGAGPELLHIVNVCAAACPPVSRPMHPEGVFRTTDNASSGGEVFRFVAAEPDRLANRTPAVTCRVQGFRATGERTSTGDESYRLTVRKPGAIGEPAVRIDARSATGIRYGLFTLTQLLRQYGRSLPSLEIRDTPSFPVRGVMLDISRDRVPRREELFHLLDLLASLKVNHLQLYTEHTFAYRNHEEIWREASPLTPREVRELDRHCRARGITLAANQNCFGHMQRWLAHPRYAPLAETSGGWDFKGTPRNGPFSLCPIDPGSIALIEDLLGQLLPNFSSQMVNINCDETFDVGQGRSRDAVRRHGIEEVYCTYVSRMVRAVRRHRFRPMMWADFVIDHPRAVELLPEDVILLVWNYEPDARFAEWCAQLTAAGREVWVCPGTSAWRSITGRTFERRGNLSAAARGLEGGASGFLVTEWGDLGHRQQLPVTLHALAHAAGTAWNAEAPDFDPRAAGLQVFGDQSGYCGKWLERIGDVDLELRRRSGPPNRAGEPTPLHNATRLFTDMHEPLNGGRFGADDLDDWETVAERLKRLGDGLPRRVPDQIRDELEHTLDVALFAARRAAMRRTRSFELRHRSARLLTDIITEHRRLWLARSRPGGLDDSCRHYARMLEELNLAAG